MFWLARSSFSGSNGQNKASATHFQNVVLPPYCRSDILQSRLGVSKAVQRYNFSANYEAIWCESFKKDNTIFQIPNCRFCSNGLPHLNYEFSWQRPLWESHEIHQTESRLQICEYWKGLRMLLIFSVLQNSASQKELFLSMRLRLSDSSKRPSCWD